MMSSRRAHSYLLSTALGRLSELFDKQSDAIPPYDFLFITEEQASQRIYSSVKKLG